MYLHIFPVTHFRLSHFMFLVTINFFFLLVLPSLRSVAGKKKEKGTSIVCQTAHLVLGDLLEGFIRGLKVNRGPFRW